ncbi:MAG: cysteine--tRNA ligase [Candidatus Accumulibacter sp.]|nr:cysteine--tRNA ligase [Accumulibacter sp.]
MTSAGGQMLARPSISGGPVIVFDVLFRLLRPVYGAEHVTYVRNITDVDDKIIAAQRTSGEPIEAITTPTTKAYEEDMAALGCLRPTLEPRATHHIAEMIAMIAALIERGHAYAAEGHVLFEVATMPGYGRLSGRNTDELLAGARVEVAPYKKGAGDFVLWKPSAADEPGWDSPWGRGRPGWHIECSAMSMSILGETFDIHGGGQDLIFPHHENEIAQSRCAHGTPVMSNVWMHNGFLQVEGEKMSKSLGNFFTINELLRTDRFGGRSWPGEVLRLAMLKTHYRQPIDWTVRALEEAEANLASLKRAVKKHAGITGKISDRVVAKLADDLNTPEAVHTLFSLAGYANGTLQYERGGAPAADNPTQEQAASLLLGSALILGLDLSSKVVELNDAQNQLITARLAARAAKNWAESDRIRDELAAQGIILKDNKDGTTTWEVKR